MSEKLDFQQPKLPDPNVNGGRFIRWVTEKDFPHKCDLPRIHNSKNRDAVPKVVDIDAYPLKGTIWRCDCGKRWIVEAPNIYSAPVSRQWSRRYWPWPW